MYIRQPPLCALTHHPHLPTHGKQRRLKLELKLTLPPPRQILRRIGNIAVLDAADQRQLAPQLRQEPVVCAGHFPEKSPPTCVHEFMFCVPMLRSLTFFSDPDREQVYFRNGHAYWVSEHIQLHRAGRDNGVIRACVCLCVCPGTKLFTYQTDVHEGGNRLQELILDSVIYRKFWSVFVPFCLMHVCVWICLHVSFVSQSERRVSVTWSSVNLFSLRACAHLLPCVRLRAGIERARIKPR